MPLKMEELSVKERIERAMNAIDWAEFAEYTMDLHAADIAEALESREIEEIERFLESLDAELVADILVEIDEDIRTQLLKTYSSEDIAHELVENMDSDDAILPMSSWRTWTVMMRRTCFLSFRTS